MLFNTKCDVSIGLQLAEFFGTNNSHFLQVISNLTNKEEAEKNKSE